MSDPLEPGPSSRPNAPRRTPLTLSLYNRLARLSEPWAMRFLEKRLGRGKEDRWRLAERLGEPSQPRPEGWLTWIHAASVGELNAVLPLVERLAYAGPTTRLLVTSGTVTSARIAAEKLPARAIHQFAPLDLPQAGRRFLDHWKPDLGLLVESELWPNLIRSAHERAVPIVLVNARLSERSAKRWAWAPHAARAVMGSLALVAAQSERDAERFKALGARDVCSVGNLKFDAPAPAVDADLLKRFRVAIGPRPVLVAASTHPGEEEILADATARLAQKGLSRPPLLFLAPRHPERGSEVAAMLAARGLKVVRRSSGRSPRGADVFLLDTIGEMGLAYRLAHVAFIGGSLVARGGQNPLEPAKLDAPILHGPNVRAFRDAYGALDGAGGARLVTNAESLAAEAHAILADPNVARAMAAAARGVVEEGEGATARVLGLLSAHLPRGAVAA